MLLYNGLENLDHPNDPRGPHCMNLFLYLWAANSEDRSCPQVQIPDTLLIGNGAMRYWLFMDTNNQMKIKTREKLNDMPRLCKWFCRPMHVLKGTPVGAAMLDRACSAGVPCVK